MASENNLNTASTLSINTTPGQDIRFPTTTSDSIFTFGSFRIEQSVGDDLLNNSTRAGNFSNYSTLESLQGEKFDSSKILTTNITPNELKSDKKNPLTYSYFGSFYTKLAVAINNIIENFPYTILSYNEGASNALYDFESDILNNTSTFKIPISTLINQGKIVYVSGITQSGFSADADVLNLYDNFDKFSIQISGETNTYPILNYNYSAGTYLNFEVSGIILSGTQTATTNGVYIRPTEERLGEFKQTISSLENQLLYDGTFYVPSDIKDEIATKQFIWPTTIDGFNPDISGDEFDNYKEELFTSARDIDDIKTNIMLRTMIPENYIDLDTETQIYEKLISTFATEFDKIKQYIDALAFSYSIDYNGTENVPDRFIQRLAKLLGIDLFDSFNDVDFFEYLTSSNVNSEKPFAEYNMEIWRKILTNINWLYKKKGTRDAIMFILKLVGAPDELIEFNEFVYKIEKVTKDELENFDDDSVSKINSYGYINYDASQFIFQEGGPGRGNGRAYIDQWEPEFSPLRQVDNFKVYTGTPNPGTQSFVNTKEIDINLTGSFAVENDVKSWYELGSGWWEWGSSHVPFSGLSVPYEWQVQDIQTVAPRPISDSDGLPIGGVPSFITGMTIAQWLDYVYTSNVRPQDRKTRHYGEVERTTTYWNLRKIYMTYMLWTNNEESNRLTNKKLSHFIELLERGFGHYIPQLIPATSILSNFGTKYRNPDFNRHRFVYPKGIDDGSMFQSKLPENPVLDLKTVVINSEVNDNYNPKINAVEIKSDVPSELKPRINSIEIVESIDLGINPDISSIQTALDFYQESVIVKYIPNKLQGDPIVCEE